MVAKVPSSSNTMSNPIADVIPAATVIDRMIELRLQLHELEQQIQALQPTFYAACATLNTSKIELTRAIISRRLTPGQWTYDPSILQQQDLLRQLKRQFQQEHEPSSGRDVIWSIKLLLAMTP
jgi:hypothetical protein